MIPVLIGIAIYQGIGLTLRHYRFPKEPVYVASAWPILLFMGQK